ncbi:MAG: hypothetical protein IJM81_05450 [Prevotella sp.]|nr:hypothetical protein [Prevotella sp.]
MEITAKRIASQPPSADTASTWLDRHLVSWTRMASSNWAEKYPYRPEVKFRIAHTGSHFVIQFDVEETSIRAVALHDNGRVWEDSCCEFFVAPDAAGTYYNFECNCIGTLLVASGSERENRQLASPEVLCGIARKSTFRHKEIPLSQGEYHWRLELIIPVSSFFCHDIGTLSGKTMRCNFYKCGDKLHRPHFLSWSPVGTLTPDFHRPDYFGTLHFSRHFPEMVLT